MAKNKENLKEFGSSGLPVFGGRIFEEPLTQLTGDRWRSVVRDMIYNDPVVGAILFTIEYLARQTTWNIKAYSDDQEDLIDRDFVSTCLFKDMETTWQDTLSEILTFLPWGWSYLEICYKHRQGESRDKTKNSRYTDGKLGWRKFALRAQESLWEWKFDDYGDVSAMVQMPEPDYVKRIVPFEKSLHFRTSSHKNNPESRSIMRSAYRPWYFKTNIENIEGIGIERDLAGLPVINLPPEYLMDSATTDQKKLAMDMRKLVRSIRRNENEGVLMPAVYDAFGNRTFYLELLSAGGKREFSTSDSINRYDQRILMSVLSDFLMLGSKAVGSYALSSDKTELFSTAMSAFLDVVCDGFNRHAIPRLQKMNGRDRARSPRLVHGDVERVSLKDLGDYVNSLSNAGIVFDEDEAVELKGKVLKQEREK